MLVCGSGPVFAASSAENRAFNAAANAFKLKSWAYAEKKFADFTRDYPKSPRVPQAILFQAEARYRLDRFTDAINLLSANRSKAGAWEVDYLFLIGQAHFRNANYAAAATVFGRLIKDFPYSTRTLEASVAEATTLAWAGEWPQAADRLQATNGAFQQLALPDPTSPLVVRGYLLLGEAQLALRNFTGAEETLEFLSDHPLDTDSSWRREYLRGRLQLAQNLADRSLQTATNLLTLASTFAQPQSQTNSNPPGTEAPEPYADIRRPGQLPESWSFLATVFEKLNRYDDAIAAYGNNLATNAPVEQQRHALLKIAEINYARNRTASAIEALENYLIQHPRSDASDMAVLAIGELQLKQQAALANTNAAAGSSPAPAPATNLVQLAMNRFDMLLNTYSNSPLAGKALLDKGWCLWMNADYALARDTFQLAAAPARLPSSMDQAVARFKWADAQFMLNDFPAAITNYSFIVSNYAAAPDIKDQLLEPVLYQIVRAALATNDMPSAAEAMRKLLDWYPNGFAGPHCLLLVGQGFDREADPAGARRLFDEFEKRYPTNRLLPEVRLAAARTYEQEGNWDAAISEYTAWSRRFTNHTELPLAEFSRAWDCYRAGRDTNALSLFASFTTRFATNELAQRAQYWIGDYYFLAGDFQNAEKNYQLVYINTNWLPSELTYQAQMMAGRMAMFRFSYKDAFAYFTNLANNPACPNTNNLKYQAYFASADAEMNLESDETNKLANLIGSIRIFREIPATNDLATPALGRIGDCYLQWAAADPAKYADASNAYSLVIRSPRATISARSQAKVRLGAVAEGLAKLKTDPEQTRLLEQAYEDYLDAFLYEDELRDGEQPDLYWVKKAGIEAGRLAENLQKWEPAYNIYKKLEKAYPSLGSFVQPKILKILKAHPEVAADNSQTDPRPQERESRAVAP